MMRADASSKTVITAYDPSKDSAINKVYWVGLDFRHQPLMHVHYFLASQLKMPIGVFIVIINH